MFSSLKMIDGSAPLLFSEQSDVTICSLPVLSSRWSVRHSPLRHPEDQSVRRAVRLMCHPAHPLDTAMCHGAALACFREKTPVTLPLTQVTPSSG